MIEIISKLEEIENLYKTGATAPYTKVEDGHGYYGVLIKDKMDGKIQCHVCGKFFDSVATHALFKHKFNARTYKETYGFPSNMPICSQKVSERLSKSIIDKVIGFQKGHKHGFKTGHRGFPRKRNRFTRTNHSLSFQNERNVCEEQLYRRYLAVSDKIGKEPSTKDLLVHDSPLMPVIQHRYKNLNNFRKKHGFTIVKPPF